MIAAESSPDLLGTGTTVTESFLAIAVCIFLVERQDARRQIAVVRTNIALIIIII